MPRTDEKIIRPGQWDEAHATLAYDPENKTWSVFYIDNVTHWDREFENETEARDFYEHL